MQRVKNARSYECQLNVEWDGLLALEKNGCQSVCTWLAFPNQSALYTYYWKTHVLYIYIHIFTCTHVDTNKTSNLSEKKTKLEIHKPFERTHTWRFFICAFLEHSPPPTPKRPANTPAELHSSGYLAWFLTTSSHHRLYISKNHCGCRDEVWESKGQCLSLLHTHAGKKKHDLCIWSCHSDMTCSLLPCPYRAPDGVQGIPSDLFTVIVMSVLPTVLEDESDCASEKDNQSQPSHLESHLFVFQVFRDEDVPENHTWGDSGTCSLTIVSIKLANQLCMPRCLVLKSGLGQEIRFREPWQVTHYSSSAC